MQCLHNISVIALNLKGNVITRILEQEKQTEI